MVWLRNLVIIQSQLWDNNERSLRVEGPPDICTAICLP